MSFVKILCQSCKHCACVACKQIQYGARGVRQDRLGAVARTGIVGGKLPCAFLAEGKDTVDDIICKASLVFNAFRRHKGIQGVAPGKIFCLIIHMVACALINHEICSPNDGKRITQIFFTQSNQVSLQLTGQ